MASEPPFSPPVLTAPAQGMIMRRMGLLRRLIAVENDRRIKVTNEVLQGVRAVKLYNWEDAYSEWNNFRGW